MPSFGDSVFKRVEDETATDDDLEKAFEVDPSSPYEMTADQLQRLLALVGEQEPVIDAILKQGGASKKARAEAIGVDESDFWYENNEEVSR